MCEIITEAGNLEIIRGMCYGKVVFYVDTEEFAAGAIRQVQIYRDP